jgi:hypothetical protein
VSIITSGTLVWVVTLGLSLVHSFIATAAMTRVRVKNVLVAFLLMAPLVAFVHKLALPLSLVRVVFLNSENDFLSNDGVNLHGHSGWNRLPVVNLACIGWTRSSAASQHDEW